MAINTLVTRDFKRPSLLFLCMAVVGYLLSVLFYQYEFLYLTAIHNAIEYVCIFIAGMTFVLSWRNRKGNVWRVHLIGILFLLVAIYDILHTFYYSSSSLSSEISRDLEIKFSLLCRATETIILILFSVLPEYHGFRKERAVFGSLLVGILLIFFIHSFPYLFRMWTPAGFSPLKVALDYVILTLLFVSDWKIIRTNNLKPIQYNYFFLRSAILLLIAAQFLFAILGNGVYDFFFLLGHFLRLAGYVCLFNGVLLHIADHPAKRMEQELKDKTNLINNVFQNSPIGIALIHGEGFFSYVNDSFCNILSLERTDLLNSSIATVFGVDEDECRNLSEILECPLDQSITIVRRYRRPELPEQFLKMTLSHVIETDSTPSLILAQMEDITADYEAEHLKEVAYRSEKMLTEAAELEKMRDVFFSNLSHEFRTPLNLMFSALQLLELHLQRDEIKVVNVQSQIRIMRQNSYRLLRLINNLIDLTRIDAGAFQLKLRNYNIVYLVEEIALSAAQYIQEKGINIIFDTDVEDKVIAVDEEKLERVLLNLISNAIKFSPPGGEIRVTISDQDDLVEISIQDTGIGIEPCELESIFERFHQVNNPNTRNAEGSGIGLSLVKSVVELHGGRILVESVPNQGSIFTIKLPAVIKLDANADDHSPANRNCVERLKIEFADIYG